ncbi:MAG: group II intron reverse transcriptase/maturase, partial [Candidatus Brocadiales bacterium]|nr:group II intron reverse transcriptase/maturase [Candidatus Brocadiales bacterium]
MHILDQTVSNPKGIFAREGIKMIRYTDDFILMGRDIPDIIIDKIRDLLRRMGLRLNEEKSRLVNVYKHSFDFLGFTFRYSRSLFDPEAWYWNIVPRKQAVLRIIARLRQIFRDKRHYS